MNEGGNFPDHGSQKRKLGTAEVVIAVTHGNNVEPLLKGKKIVDDTLGEFRLADLHQPEDDEIAVPVKQVVGIDSVVWRNKFMRKPEVDMPVMRMITDDLIPILIYITENSFIVSHIESGSFTRNYK